MNTDTSAHQRQAGRAPLPPRVLLADDEEAFREVVRKLYERAGFDCVTASRANEALDLLEREHFDVFVTDIYMPDNADLDFLNKLVARGVEVPVIVVTGSPELETAIEAVDLKVAAYLVKPMSFSKLEAATIKALNERVVGSSPTPAARVASTGLSAEERGRLSERELELVDVFVTGKGVRELAEVLGISTHTVRNHLKSVFKKLEVNSQVQLMAKLRG